MSMERTEVLFEGFLQKRKDTMKLKWATYWFRLQNTTLFFYTKENCSASHLRGYYYIYTVQSVREVQREDSRRFMFEIVMTNGKRKMLAAETADLRKQWVSNLWRAMNLSTSGVSDFSNRHPEAHRDRVTSSLPAPPPSDGVLQSLPARPLSAPTGLVHRDPPRFCAPPVDLDSEEATYQNFLPSCGSHSPSGVERPESSAEPPAENDYDVLPIRKYVHQSDAAAQPPEGDYDFPLSYRRAAEDTEQTESVYDVPSSLMRRLSVHSSEEELLDGIYSRI